MSTFKRYLVCSCGWFTRYRYWETDPCPKCGARSHWEIVTAKPVGIFRKRLQIRKGRYQ